MDGTRQLDRIQADPEDAIRLSQFLRSHPGALGLSTAELAAAAQVPLELAEVALAKSIHGDLRSRNKQLNLSNPITKAIGTFLDRISAHLSFVVTVSSALSLAIGAFFDFIINKVDTSRGYALGPEGNGLLIASTILHFVCYFRQANIAATIRASASLYGVLLLFGIFAVSKIPETTETSRPEMLTAISAAFMFLMLMYIAIALVASVIGGYVKMRSEKMALESLSRQQLLDRMFEIEGRLQSYPRDQKYSPTVMDWPISRAFRAQPYLWAVFFGFFLALASNLIPGASKMSDPGATSIKESWFLVFSILITLSVGMQIFVSYCAKGMWKSILASCVYQASSLVPNFFPINGFGWNYVKSLEPWMHYTGLGFALVIGLIGGLGGIFGDWAATKAKLKENNAEMLLNELVQIQRLLQPTQKHITVMVVDAAKSAAMKAQADPFVAEWSFRAYQEMVAEIATKHDGYVFAEAGDGATLIFPEPGLAMVAAWEIQEQIHVFNAEKNKLSSPFELRIGIHRGKVTGDIDKIQYAEVIDVAAHIQANAPVGGVAISDAVVEFADPKRVQPTETTVDGFKLSILEQEH